MNEIKRILEAARAARQANETAVLATVVRVAGSTYRRPGARMLLTERGETQGSISGGCLEGDVAKRAWWITQSGPKLVTYDSTAEDEDIAWGFGLGCNGVVEVLLERTAEDSPAQAALHFWEMCLAERVPGVLATVIEAQNAPVSVGGRGWIQEGGAFGGDLGAAVPRLIRDVAADAGAALVSACSTHKTYTLMDGGSVTVFFEYVAPPLSLVVLGAGHDALPLVRLAKEQMGWHVTVADTRSATAKAHRFPLADSVLAGRPVQITEQVSFTSNTAVVVMTHNYADDRELLRRLLPLPLRYLGALGPKRRTERILAELGYEATAFPHLHAPIGLDIGADNPDEIALSVVSEIQAVAANRAGGFLRERPASIHDRKPEDAGTRRGEPHPKAVCERDVS